jgi:N-acyl-D-amino-acid deacylase
VIDRATYENPALPSEGIRHVLVNGVVALTGGAATGARGGRALARTANMPSRPTKAGPRSLSVKGTAAGRAINVTLTQRAGARDAAGRIAIDGVGPIAKLGVLQVADGWAAVTGVDASGRAVSVLADLRDPAAEGAAVVIVTVAGEPVWRATLPPSALTVR